MKQERDPQTALRDCGLRHMCVTISLASYFASLAMHEFKVIVFKAKERKRKKRNKENFNQFSR